MDSKKRVEEIDSMAETRQLSENEIIERERGYSRILELERFASLDLRQKAILKWVVDGDENTNFFHGYVNNRARRNQIHGFVINAEWTSRPVEMNNAAVTFFSNKFHEKWVNIPNFQSDLFRKLSPSDAEFIEALISIAEIKNAIWSCGSEKALGSDGFTMKFFKKYWETIKDDVLVAVKHF